MMKETDRPVFSKESPSLNTHRGLSIRVPIDFGGLSSRVRMNKSTVDSARPEAHQEERGKAKKKSDPATREGSY